MGPRWPVLAFMGHRWFASAFGDFRGSSLTRWPASVTTHPRWLSWALVGLHSLLGTSMGPRWLRMPLLACAGCRWSLLACVSFHGSLLAGVGFHGSSLVCISFWRLPWVLTDSLACIGHHTSSLAFMGPRWPAFAFGDFRGSSLASHAFVGLCWLPLVFAGLR